MVLLQLASRAGSIQLLVLQFMDCAVGPRRYDLLIIAWFTKALRKWAIVEGVWSRSDSIGNCSLPEDLWRLADGNPKC